MKKIKLVRKKKRDESATTPSGFHFALLPEGTSSLQIEKNAGKNTPESRFTEEFFPERGA